MKLTIEIFCGQVIVVNVVERVTVEELLFHISLKLSSKYKARDMILLYNGIAISHDKVLQEVARENSTLCLIFKFKGG